MTDTREGKVSVGVLACNKCGAPMYPDMEKGGFHCAYCGEFFSFALTDADFTPGMTFRHQPLQEIDGYLKLGHVAIMDKKALQPPPSVEWHMRRTRLVDKIREYDEAALNAINDKTYIDMNCPHCGKKLTPRLTDNIFTCPHCGQKFGDFGHLSTGDFDEALIVGRKYNFDGKCLPFNIKPSEARQAISALGRQNRNDFLDDDIEARAETELIAAYVPVQLADFRWKYEVSSDRGTFWFYQECLNWAWVCTLMFDWYLLDELAPWDYGKISIMKPAYLEGNVRLFASQNIGEWQAAIPNYVLQSKIPYWLRSGLGIWQCKLLQASHDLRKHKFAFLLLPIYFLDCKREAGENDRQIRVMVNGQTGKAAALILSPRERDIIRTAEPIKPYVFTKGGERTILSPPMPVKYVKSPFLHEKIRL
ncbi:hypothetical protein [Anaerovibrio sp. RM50]|uniref:hypothetical protein n=1 Tax=Anaerovibrio sp. RM50 TaxID=1200557 RepID=UPI00047F692B|nr:hypothetical protein [Anaerovibrio sp. RM50]